MSRGSSHDVVEPTPIVQARTSKTVTGDWTVPLSLPPQYIPHPHSASLIACIVIDTPESCLGYSTGDKLLIRVCLAQIVFTL